MDSNYWTNFWNEYTSKTNYKDEQTQVLRTWNKEPISEEVWNYTLQIIDTLFDVNKNDIVLDLCSGNGLLAKHFVSKGAKVVAVDISQHLLKSLKGIKDLETLNSDIREINFNKNTFNKIIIYAGIQYLNDNEAIVLLQKIYTWLKPNGILFIGDIPDLSKRWNFYNTIERQKVYFENVLNERPIVGNWFEKTWFENLTTYLGFKEGKYIEQDEKLIYSNFRFDFVFKK